MRRLLRILAASILAALAPLALAQTGEAPPPNPGQAQVSGRIADTFAILAGSRENAVSLVNALRTGTSTTLVTTTPGLNGAPPTIVETAFAPPTRPMGWGNVRILLALAQDQLARLGITNPTNEQLLAALNGGEVTIDGTTTALRGVLQMRAEGMGMGQIAQASGTRLGPVMAGLRKTAAAAPASAPKSPTLTTASGNSPGSGGKTAKGHATASGQGSASASRGLTTASGATASASSRGLVTAGGAASGHSSRGLVSAGSGAANASANAQGLGRGLVTGAGGAAGSLAASTHGRGQGAGIIHGGGNSAGATTTAHGSGQGRGNAGGNGKGRGG